MHSWISRPVLPSWVFHIGAGPSFAGDAEPESIADRAGSGGFRFPRAEGSHYAPGMTQDVESGGEALPEVRFEDLPGGLQKAMQRVGWERLMPVQAKAIPYLRAGRDLMVQSRTGTGKTGAFLLPILERVDPDAAVCQALVLVPTRELARQVIDDAESLAHGSPVRHVALYGGVGYGPQLDALEKGAHLVVGTPGRILDHLMRGTLVLDDLKILIFDEADRMLSMGFYPDMRELSRYLPRERDGFMFSATYPQSVLTLARQFLSDPEFLGLSSGHEHVAETEHVYYEVASLQKERALVRIIEIENPEAAIIFCNRKTTTRYVATVLDRFGYDAEMLSAELTQKARERVLARAYDRRLRFLVATDVAGRGIDISHLTHVFLYEFPEDPESYIHRTGRTGRAGASGTAISLADPLERLALKDVARRFKVPIERRDLPTDQDVEGVVAERVTALLENKLRNLDTLVRERMQRMMPLARTLMENEDERAIIAMLLDEYYQKMLHAAPDVPDAEPGDEPARDAGASEAGESEEGRGRRGGRRRRKGGRGGRSR
jgi:ATP-dependent RNA helicase DeaD